MLLPSGAGSRRKIALYVQVTVLLVVGIGAAVYTYQQVDTARRLHILDRVSTVAQVVSESDIHALSGSEADISTPAYERIKTLLADVRSVNRDVRFIYLIGQQGDGKLFFYADSEPETSEDYSPPGQPYDEASPGMYAVFDTDTSQTEGPDRDRWGIWISGYAPVTDASGKVIALMGMDLPAYAYLFDLLVYSSLPLLVMCMVLVPLITSERRREREHAFIEQKEEFLSVASHEIRTPLTGIRWAVEAMLSDGPGEKHSERDMLELVHANVLSIISRISNLLDVSSLERRPRSTLRKERIDIQELLSGIAQSLTLSARGRGMTIMLDPGVRSSGSFDGDPQLIHQVFFNLISNAIKYGNAGTPITVFARHCGDTKEFKIVDEGREIPVAERSRIFEGYHRTSDAVKGGQPGSGLGLYLVKHVVELHKGTITVESVPGRTTFRVLLPS